MLSDEPVVGGLYRHYGGNYYVVVGFCRDQDNEECVGYLALLDGTHWVRKLKEWYAPHDGDHRRYIRVAHDHVQRRLP